MSDRPTDVAIEAAGGDDVTALVDLWLDLAADQRRHGSHLRTSENRPVIHETMVRHVVADTALLARRGDAVVGFVTFAVETGRYEQDRSRGVIHNVYVRPSDRDDGIGTALLEAAEADLASRGVDAVSLQAMARNEPARRFYSRRGYTAHRIELEKPINDGSEGTDGDA
ncbi:GNAT family N-acetyltransferase [Natronomonas sp.]|uniref:GNAT family N-acetyltransferase n=1 Tax=Natronomonas sp. TaxID=2184060 RepID=UPI002618F3BD|nr:GNAT family N-acetyltransferase [Natronomonas sp.]